jgi:hypothetical protein
LLKAGANDGVQTQAVLEAMVGQPPAAVAVADADPRDLPRAGRRRLRQPPHRGSGQRRRLPDASAPARPGPAAGGRIRCAIERGPAFLAQFGRSARRYLGWIEWAAGVILIRAEATVFFR